MHPTGMMNIQSEVLIHIRFGFCPKSQLFYSLECFGEVILILIQELNANSLTKGTMLRVSAAVLSATTNKNHPTGQ